VTEYLSGASTRQSQYENREEGKERARDDTYSCPTSLLKIFET
jgi:hypothetical protein